MCQTKPRATHFSKAARLSAVALRFPTCRACPIWRLRRPERAATLTGGKVHVHVLHYPPTTGLVHTPVLVPPRYSIMEGPEASSPSQDLASSNPPTRHSLAPDPPASNTDDPTWSMEPAHLVPGQEPRHPSLPTYHVRAPSAAALTIDTEPNPFATTNPIDTSYNSSTVEGAEQGLQRQSATAPIAIHEGRLRSVWSTASLGSLSPGSALSSPALNALGEITPLPSPLVMSDSPGPWQRAPPRSRGASASSRDDNFPFFSKGSVSPSPSLKKKSYHKLKTAMSENTAAANTHTQQNNNALFDRNRSVSEYTPEALHNVRTRQVTVGHTAGETDGNTQQHMHREEYLATQRGLIPAKIPVGLPTPPASNASNRSVTDTEEEDLADDDKTRYIVVRHGPQKTKKLWRPVRQLGQGTFSKVYLATCERTTAKDPLDESTLDPHKLVAIKVCEHGPAGGADEQRVELSLKREVEMLRSISHPSLIHLQAFDHNEAQALIVLTYCPGGDLFDAASAHRDILTVNFVQRIFAEMVSAVRYLHTKLIVHRDIKLESTVSHFYCVYSGGIFVCISIMLIFIRCPHQCSNLNPASSQKPTAVSTCSGNTYRSGSFPTYTSSARVSSPYHQMWQ